MARVVDITNRIKTEDVFLAYNGKQFKLDDSKNTTMKAMQMIGEDESMEGMDKVIALFMGAKAAKELTDGISFPAYQALFVSIMAEVTQTSYEDTKARFLDR